MGLVTDRYAEGRSKWLAEKRAENDKYGFFYPTWGETGISPISNPDTKVPDINIPNINFPTANIPSIDLSKKYSDVDLSKYSGGYKKSDSVLGYENKANAAEDYVSNYGKHSYEKQAEWDSIIDQIQNRKEFNYDVNADALYKQYEDQFLRGANLAMQDTMGQASAMTGGYGNSYASTVGNQAYQQYMAGLTDIIPELEQRARENYNQDTADLYNKYSLYSDDYARSYGEWSDGYNMAVADRDYYASKADSEYAKDYGQYVDSYNRDYQKYWDDTQFGYAKDRDAVADAQWRANYDAQKAQFEYDKQMDEQALVSSMLQAAVSGSGTSSGTSSGGASENGANSANLEYYQEMLENEAYDMTPSGAATYINGLLTSGLITEEQASTLWAESGVGTRIDGVNYDSRGYVPGVSWEAIDNIVKGWDADEMTDLQQVASTLPLEARISMAYEEGWINEYEAEYLVEKYNITL